MSENSGKSKWKLALTVLERLQNIAKRLKTRIDRINEKKKGKYSVTFIACASALFALLIVVFMLFIPPYLGVADDGSFARVANPVGIYHVEDTDANNYLNYYTKNYVSLPEAYAGANDYVTSQRLFIIAAKYLDMIFTNDNSFDMRFMGLVYLILFIPAIALIIKQGIKGSNNFSEEVIIALAGVLFFADVVYVTYFSSFYAEPVMYICILYCAGAALELQDEKNNTLYLILYTVSGVILTTVRQQCSIIGIILAIFCVKCIFIRKELLWKAGCVGAAFILFITTAISFNYIQGDFDKYTKYHSMTRGVLFQAQNPEKALAEFGIDSSYAVLTDTNASDKYPFVSPYNKNLNKGFYDKFDANKILLYYLKHPKAMVAMLDISVKSAFSLRRSESGNYEKTVGLPKMAKSIFWCVWSSFKVRSAPKTFSFVIILMISLLLLSRKRIPYALRNNKPRLTIPIETAFLIFSIGLSQAVITIVNCGDSELIEHLFLFSVSIDLLIYLCFAQILHKLNVI